MEQFLMSWGAPGTSEEAKGHLESSLRQEKGAEPQLRELTAHNSESLGINEGILTLLAFRANGSK